LDWEAFGAIGEILGALAVIASLFYVAYQVRQNTEQNKLNNIAIQSASGEAINIALNDARLKLAGDSELANIYMRGLENPSSLTEEELFRFRLFMGIGVSNGQLSFESEKRGVSAQWAGVQNTVLRMLATPGGSWFWKEFRNDYPEEYRTEIDSLIEQHTG
jgi:hypothetical protein